MRKISFLPLLSILFFNSCSKTESTNQQPLLSFNATVSEFIQGVESNVHYNVAYDHPTTNLLWSAIDSTYLKFPRIPTWYGESSKKGEYQFRKSSFHDTSTFEITVYNKTGYNFVHYEVCFVGSEVQIVNIVSLREEDSNACQLVYDKMRNPSDIDISVQKFKKINEIMYPIDSVKRISLAQIEKEVKNLL